MSTIWNRHFSQPTSGQTLPLAVAMLVPTASPAQLQLKVAEILTKLPVVTSIWLGETTGPIADFSVARNSALAQISEPWVFWLDSDETLAPLENLNQLKQTLTDPKTIGVYLQRVDLFHGQVLRFGETGQLKLLRIHRVKTGIFINQVHEVFWPQAPTNNLKSLPIKLYHHSHNSISEFLTKISRYALIRAKERLAQKNHPSSWQLIWELLWWPIGKFGYNYVWKQGYLDGYRGLVYAVMMSVHSSLVRIFALELLLKAKLN